MVWYIRYSTVDVDTAPCGAASYLQGGDDFIAHLLDRNHIAAGLGVDDAFLLLPANHDGFLTVSRAAHLLLLTLRGQRGVGVGRDHSRDWGKKKARKRRGRHFDLLDGPACTQQNTHKFL